ncbi:GntR family transcriptional regulator [Pseudaestuariivita atlantica]|uniref:HTH gntR-type domain-containing protein n=1 Tax=Pseudaestuariivita atlantica TaxID=1317121 RepID=A0A0L1JWD0_9RHOB|nr:GntR family transcriptional regulator [Pseudaestuariivita atlantica]KNG95713.1 hypothetical protein ATO11_03380 [Pseudaestuariivita atlantica]
MGLVQDSTAWDVVDRLRAALLDGRFAHGSKLKPDTLRTSLGCSASAVREALFRLSTEGLVQFHPQRGFRVPQRDIELLHDITQVRIMIEEQGACRSIRNADVAWEARLTAAHHKLSHIESRVQRTEPTDEVFQLWVRGEQEFHQTLIGNCGSQILVDMHLAIYRRFRQQMVTSDRDFTHLPVNRDQHLEILDAALARDEDGVCRRIRAHLGRHLVRPIPEREAVPA